MRPKHSSVVTPRRRLTPRCGRRGRPRFIFESLETRLALALHIENFSDDLDPTQPGFDSWDADPLTVPGGDTDADPNTRLGPDEFLIPHQTSSGQVFFLFREDPSVASFALGISGVGDWYETDFAANRNLPGGLAQDEVAAVGIEFFGAGTILFVGENGVKTVTARNWSGWDRVTVTSNDPSDSGAEMGPIERVLVTVDATSVPRGMVVDNITVLVVDSGFSNHPPEAANDFKNTLPGQPVDVDFMANDGDPDGDPISFVAFRKLPSFGHFSVTTNPATNRPIATYTPAAGFHGIDTFEYEITDNRGTPPGTARGTVRVTVNTPPQGHSQTFLLPHGHTGAFHVSAGEGLLAASTDADGHALTIRLISTPQHGTLTLHRDELGLFDGSFTFTSTTRFATDSFSYVVNDGFVDSEIIHVNLVVENIPPRLLSNLRFTDVNDVPAPGVPDPLVGDIAWTDDDGDAVMPLIIPDHRPRHGRVELRIVGDQVRVEYYPHHGQFAIADEFRVAVSDGLAQSFSTIVRVTRGDNTPPTARDDFFDIQNRPVGIADTEPVLFAFPGVAWNDDDVDDDFLATVLISGPTHGQLTLEEDGRFIYRPDRGFWGVDTFVYRVDDGSGIASQATVTMRVLDERVPTAFDDSILREWNGNLIPSDISPEEYTHREYGEFVADNDVQPADWHVGDPPSADWALRLIPRPRQLAGNGQLFIHEGGVRQIEHLGWIGFQPWTRDISGNARITFITGEVEATYAFADLNHPGYLSNFARFRVFVAPPALGSHTIFQIDENDAWFPLPPIDVQSSPGTLLEHARLVDPPAPVHLAGFEVWHDVAMELTISGMGPGGAATVTLTYAGSLPAGAKYMKYGRRDDNLLTAEDESQPQWYDFSYDPATGTGAQIVGNQVILHFVDGLRGDSNQLSDGLIADPGVLARQSHLIFR